MKTAKTGLFRATFGALTLLVTALWTAPGGAQAPPAPAQGTPAAVAGLFYRPLTTFSRGGRVTAVAGVPSNPQL